MKKYIAILLTVILSVFIVGCNNAKTYEEIEATLIVPDGLPSIAISKAINDTEKIEYVNMNYSIQKTSDLLVAELMKGEAEMAIIPSNLALQAYKKDLGYKIAATIGWGSFYLVGTEDISGLEDLKGKEIYNTGKGLTPDIIFKEILSENNISEDDVNLSYVGAASELAPLLISGKAKYAVVPEPALSTVMAKASNIKIILNLNEEWAENNNVENGYPQSTLVIKEDFYKEIKESGVYDEILNVIHNSEEYVVNNPQEIAEICENIGITINKDVIEQSMENSNLKFTDIDDCKDEYNIYFSIIDPENKGEDNEYNKLFIEK